ncbi:unnamed protein product [Onchocerca flexuosa]|uniref:Rab-GAP TBC domain-containing protein n=1 Tax=Onchocerca flexuosa TaxID=387005 RepID=A0A183H4J9_9BILA|nr:unnamed protein product [Onchocerca flexuosa]
MRGNFCDQNFCTFSGLSNTLIGRDGDIVYSKNNVCIHDVCKNNQKDTDDSIQHIPGYLTLQCQSDDILGITLKLQWLPNTTLEKNPKSIQSVSQKNQNGSFSPISDQQFLVCQPRVSKTELDPEEGLYEQVSWGFWKSYKNQDGSIDDSFTMRKAIYFATVDPTLRREVWPFLLRVYPWTSTLEQREIIRNDIFIEYQKIKKRRYNFAFQQMKNAFKTSWINVENAIIKDVIRTDRCRPYFAGNNNTNTDAMKNILLNYATAYPEISYVQGMSDLLAPLLSTIHDEPDTYWCFVGFMQQQTLFVSIPVDGRSVMEINLKYLHELLKIFVPDFFTHVANLGSDALELMFVHRWILLCYKREFSEIDTLHIWETCWTHYRTSHFHLFIAVAIISIYGRDVIEQCLPNDEILLYFSSLAMHLDVTLVLKKVKCLKFQMFIMAI